MAHVPDKMDKKTKWNEIKRWYLMFICLNVPIVGWIYLLVLLFNKKNLIEHNFAVGLFLYKCTIFLGSVLFLYLIIHTAIPYIEALLNYMEML